MTLYVNNKKQTEALKKVLKPQTQNKLVAAPKKSKSDQKPKEPYLPLRGG